MKAAKNTPLAAPPCNGTNEEMHGASASAGASHPVGNVIAHDFKKKKSVEAAEPQHELDIASMTRTQLAKKYASEYTSYRSRKYEAARDNIPWDETFETFGSLLRLLGPKPNPTFTLDKIVAEKGYVLGNVKWASKSEQAINRSTTHFLTIGDVTNPISHWARLRNISENTIRSRLRRGWPHEDALNPNLRHSRNNVSRRVRSEAAPWPSENAERWEAAFQKQTGGEGSRLAFLARICIGQLIHYPDPPVIDYGDRELSVVDREALEVWQQDLVRLEGFFRHAQQHLAAKGVRIEVSEDSLRHLSAVAPFLD